ncbi:MAG TPA: sulfurtransferase [Desulfobacteraceae bacterium]|jgi:rhodanese-related sulfurtransferase|nr:sulfurtransferase [Desulfobacteraceae bacterium]
MRKRNFVLFTTSIILLFFVSLAMAQAPVPSSQKKQTITGNYATALQAYEMWKANPDKVKILDCRTPEEYVYLGHPEMAHNIPSSVWTGVWNAEKKSFALKENPDFEAEAKKRFKADDTILIMCRSGNRSAASANRLAEAGFTDVYNMVDGFEGDKVKDEESYYNGKRMKNGWKNSGAPWTYDLDPKLIYATQQ